MIRHWTVKTGDEWCLISSLFFSSTFRVVILRVFCEEKKKIILDVFSMKEKIKEYRLIDNLRL
jgi:hypothetical protein